MPTLKSISADSYHVRPFITHKTQQYTLDHGESDNSDGISVDLAIKPPHIEAWDFDPHNDPVNGDGLFQSTLYSSIEHIFYNSASPWNGGKQLQIPSGSQLYVVNLAQANYGEGIYPGSFSLSVGSSTGSIMDDGKGRLTVGPSGSQVGHIFYTMGIATIQFCSGSGISSTGMQLQYDSTIDISFKASHTIFEHNIMCTMDVGEYAYTVNPSIRKSTLSGELAADIISSGSMTPYMTTIGLYNNQNELVAIAKFPRAIKRAPESQQTVIIRFDV